MKRAAAYCRVSTDHEDQANSLENQKSYWEDYIRSRGDLIFSGLYVDEGITGTSTLKRDGFLKMIEDAEKGKMDLILTKEVSRFGRNIVDVLRYTRYLKKIGVGVWFESDGIFTLDSDGELRLSLMATLAQEESRKTSQRVIWGQRRAMKNGVVFGGNRVLGYELINKQLYINEKEAEIVKAVYQMFLDGMSLRAIARRLNESGISGKLGGRFDHATIRSILQNEKYCGDLVQGKTFKEDFLSHKQIINKGQKEQIVIRNHHPAIIERQFWEQVQSMLGNQRQGHERGKGSVFIVNDENVVARNINAVAAGADATAESANAAIGNMNAANAIMNAANVNTAKSDANTRNTGDANVNPATGVATAGQRYFCGICGRKMKRRKAKSGGECTYWVCSGYHYYGKKGCENNKRYMDRQVHDCLNGFVKNILDGKSWADLAQQIGNMLHSYFADPGLKLAGGLVSDSIEKDTEKIRNNLERVRNKRKKLLEIYLSDNGLLSGEEYKIRDEEFRKEERLLLERLNQYQKADASHQSAESRQISEERLKRIVGRAEEIVYDFAFTQELLRNWPQKVLFCKDYLELIYEK